MTPRYGVSRRAFLARIGVLGAVAGTVGPGALLPTATQGRPAVVAGPSPLDGLVDLVAALDTQRPEPPKASVSGRLRFVGGALLEFPSFGSYSEWAVRDAGTRQLRSTPVGWQLTGYGGVSDGWPELLGYYQDRTAVSD